MISQYLSAGTYYGIIVIYTGLLTTLTLVCKNFSQIMAIRYLRPHLSCVEKVSYLLYRLLSGFAVVIQPLAVIITSMW